MAGIGYEPSGPSHGTVVDTGSRFDMGVKLLQKEFTNGITGRDLVGDIGRGVRNAFGFLFRLPAQVIPSIANAASNQKFELWKGGDFPDATSNALGNVYRTAKEGNLLGTASAALSEINDVVVDEPLGLVGGAPYHIRAVTK